MPISRKIDGYLANASWIRKLFEEGNRMRAEGGGPVYDFSIGNPELEPPALFKETLTRLAADASGGMHRYMSNVGYDETRAAVAGSLSSDYGLPFVADQVIMTVGAGGAINTALKALLDPGEEVVVSVPYFVEYRFYIDNHQGVMVAAPMRRSFDLDPDAIEAKITELTRIVLINNPHNPTGVVYPQETLDRLGEMLRRVSAGRDRPIFLIDDAPYRKLVYDIPRCTNPFSAYEHTLMATSHSKDLGLPGERIGFLAVSPRCMGWQRVAGALAFTNRTLGYVNAPALMQRVVAHLQDVTIDLGWYRRKRDLLYKELTRMGYRMPYPGGAFYIFPEAPGGDDIAFMQKLKDMRVLVVPGTGFGMRGHFRVSYCMRDEVIEGALPAFEQAIRG
ncbi:MAG: pyridoxal phosphate-dependent aminotransferase [Deltaproteobacteria bacterium]|nr:pyridoxal phosphate-dependent aminotransferase [Deltaproteobacteria bacterium]